MTVRRPPFGAGSRAGRLRPDPRHIIAVVNDF